MRLCELGIAGEADDGVLAVCNWGVALEALDRRLCLLGVGIGLSRLGVLFGHVTPIMVLDFGRL